MTETDLWFSLAAGPRLDEAVSVYGRPGVVARGVVAGARPGVPAASGARGPAPDSAPGVTPDTTPATTADAAGDGEAGAAACRVPWDREVKAASGLLVAAAAGGGSLPAAVTDPADARALAAAFASARPWLRCLFGDRPVAVSDPARGGGGPVVELPPGAARPGSIRVHLGGEKIDDPGTLGALAAALRLCAATDAERAADPAGTAARRLSFLAARAGGERRSGADAAFSLRSPLDERDGRPPRAPVVLVRAFAPGPAVGPETREVFRGLFGQIRRLLTRSGSLELLNETDPLEGVSASWPGTGRGACGMPVAGVLSATVTSSPKGAGPAGGAGGVLRITLSDPESDAPVWSADVVSCSPPTTERIVREILRVTRPDRVSGACPAAARVTRDAAAYTDYLRASALAASGRERDVTEAARLAARAAGRDPGLVQARALAAETAEVRYHHGWGVSLEELSRYRHDVVECAAEAPSSATVCRALVGLSWSTGDTAGGLAAAAGALAYRPADPVLRCAYGLALNRNGLPRRAVSVFDRLVRSDPCSVPARSYRVWSYLLSDDPEAVFSEGMNHLQRNGLDVETSWAVAHSLLRRERHEECVRFCHAVLTEVTGGAPLRLVCGYARTAAGEAAEAADEWSHGLRSANASLAAGGPNERVLAWRAALHGALGDRKAASADVGRTLRGAGATTPYLLYRAAQTFARLGETGPAADLFSDAVDGGFACLPLFDAESILGLSAFRRHPRVEPTCARLRAIASEADARYGSVTDETSAGDRFPDAFDPSEGITGC